MFAHCSHRIVYLCGVSYWVTVAYWWSGPRVSKICEKWVWSKFKCGFYSLLALLFSQWCRSITNGTIQFWQNMYDNAIVLTWCTWCKLAYNNYLLHIVHLSKTSQLFETMRKKLKLSKAIQRWLIDVRQDFDWLQRQNLAIYLKV